MAPRGTSEVGQLREGTQKVMGACLELSSLPSLCQGLQAPSGQQLRDKKGDISNNWRCRVLVTPKPPLLAEAVAMLEVEHLRTSRREGLCSYGHFHGDSSTHRPSKSQKRK